MTNPIVEPEQQPHFYNYFPQKDLESRIDNLLYEHCEDLTDVQHIKFKKALLAEFKRVEVKARVDEILQFSNATTVLQPNETWKQWAYRVTDYFNNRIATLTNPPKPDQKEE